MVGLKSEGSTQVRSYNTPYFTAILSGQDFFGQSSLEPSQPLYSAKHTLYILMMHGVNENSKMGYSYTS